MAMLRASSTTLTPGELRDRLTDPRPRLGIRTIVIFVAALVTYSWGIAGTEARPSELADGIPNIWNFLVRLMPPQWALEDFTVAVGSWSITSFPIPEIMFAIVETIQMALIGTTLAIIISLPFGLLAARNVSPHRWIYQSTRLLLNMNRAVPDIIFALVFVAAVGLGPFSGVLALTIGAIGFMGKLYAEAIESIDPQQVQAVTATGANRIQTFIYGVVPQALPLVASYSLLLFEQNVRSATILGIVGAGGVGFVLSKYMALFQYQELMGALALIILVVTLIDRVSDAVRRRIV